MRRRETIKSRFAWAKKTKGQRMKEFYQQRKKLSLIQPKNTPENTPVISPSATALIIMYLHLYQRVFLPKNSSLKHSFQKSQTKTQ